jgi:histone H3/H4
MFQHFICIININSAGRVTIMPKDLLLARRIRGEPGQCYHYNHES